MFRYVQLCHKQPSSILFFVCLPINPRWAAASGLIWHFVNVSFLTAGLVGGWHGSKSTVSHREPCDVQSRMRWSTVALCAKVKAVRPYGPGTNLVKDCLVIILQPFYWLWYSREYVLDTAVYPLVCALHRCSAVTRLLLKLCFFMVIITCLHIDMQVSDLLILRTLQST